ncbi:MAG: hypothetical protein ACRDZ8_15360 [Acidimicrobiales bacterium]
MTFAISAVEPLVAWRFFGARGPLSAPLSRLQQLTSLRPARPLHDLLARNPVFLALCVAQLTLSAAVFAWPNSRLGWALVVIANLLYLRLRPGLDASDAMARVILAANAIRLINPAALTTPFVLFVGLEACLAYFTSGWSKLGSTIWIEGRALAKTLSTISYGDPLVSRALWRYPVLTRLASWSTVAVEVLFPLALVVPEPFGIGLMVAGAAFHACCARIMALGSFFWVFVATYSCVLATRSLLPANIPIRAGVLLAYVAAVAGQLGSTVVEYRRAGNAKTSVAPEPTPSSHGSGT